MLDRDPRFTSRSWAQLMDLCGVQFKMFICQHPQTDGSTEILNWMVSSFLQCYDKHRQREWDALLMSAEYPYNSASVESLGMTPFEADPGWPPKPPLGFLLNKRQATVQKFKLLKPPLAANLEDAQLAINFSRLVKLHTMENVTRRPIIWSAPNPFLVVISLLPLPLTLNRLKSCARNGMYFSK